MCVVVCSWRNLISKEQVSGTWKVNSYTVLKEPLCSNLDKKSSRIGMVIWERSPHVLVFFC